MYKGKTTTLMIMDLTITGLMFLIPVNWTQMMMNNIMKMLKQATISLSTTGVDGASLHYQVLCILYLC